MHGDQDCLKQWMLSNVNQADRIISLVSLLLCGANWFVLSTFIHAWQRNKTKHSHIFPDFNPLILLYQCILHSLLPIHLSRASQNLFAFAGLETRCLFCSLGSSLCCIYSNSLLTSMHSRETPKPHRLCCRTWKVIQGTQRRQNRNFGLSTFSEYLIMQVS